MFQNMLKYIGFILLFENALLINACPFGFAGKNCDIQCGKINNPKEKIYGGSIAVPNSWPYNALIKITRGDSNYLCGGTLIDLTTVLTAAQCVNLLGLNFTFTVYFGVRNISNLDENQIVKIKASKIKIHEKFNEKTYENDIALVELSKKVTLNKHIQIACLPPNKILLYPKIGEQVWGIGFGQTNSTDTSNKQLRNAKFTVYDMNACKGVYSFVKKDFQKQICAGDLQGVKDLCFGDYGSGLYYSDDNLNGKYVVGGIVSYGAGCGNTGLPWIFTRVNGYKEWITKNL